MELELCAGEIQSYCDDISDAALALIRSALSLKCIGFLKNNVELITYNREQYDNLDRIIDDVMFTFTNYYYAAGDNYAEHPYYNVTLYEGKELKDYHENYFDNNPIFKVEYENLSDTTTRIMFSIKDKDKCIQALDEYCSIYGCDGVLNDECNVLTSKAQDKQLYALLTENDYNLKNFVINDLKYIKALCYNEYKDKVSISNVFLGFDKDNKLAFKCTIAATEFVENYGKENITEDAEQEAKVKTDKQKKPRKHFSPSVQDLYNYIRIYAKARDYMIYPNDLVGDDRRSKLYDNMGTLTTMVNRLNKQYREISNDDTVTLMRYNKSLECYMITDVWNN